MYIRISVCILFFIIILMFLSFQIVSFPDLWVFPYFAFNVGFLVGLLVTIRRNENDFSAIARFGIAINVLAALLNPLIYEISFYTLVGTMTNLVDLLAVAF